MKYETTVQSVIQRTPNVLSLRFPRAAELEYKPGQFFFVTLKKDGKELSHHFSFSSSPTEPDHIEFTKKLSDSEYSQALKAAKPGDWARIDGPMGNSRSRANTPRLRCWAAESASRPFIELCAETPLTKRLDSQHCVVLWLPNTQAT